MIEFVERLVTDGNLAPGDMLPTQAELAAAAGVSLITVRRALEELERAGRVRRHQGVGTFLARPRIISEPGRSGGLPPPPRRGTRGGPRGPGGGWGGGRGGGGRGGGG